jgi:hypothetical protein
LAPRAHGRRRKGEERRSAGGERAPGSMGGRTRVLAALLALAAAGGGVTRCAAQLRQDYYAAVCPDVEKIVRDAVAKKVQATPIAIGATIRLLFHDCFVEVRRLASLSRIDLSRSPPGNPDSSERQREPMLPAAARLGVV